MGALMQAIENETAGNADSTQAGTPEIFDYEYYEETGKTWNHEVDNPMAEYPDFEVNNEAQVANHHVGEAVDALIGIGAAMNAMEKGISNCTYMTFPPEPSADGRPHYASMHDMQYHPDTGKPYGEVGSDSNSTLTAVTI